MLHNSPTLNELDKGPVVDPPEVVLRGTVNWQGEKILKTRLSETYPVELATEYAELTKVALDLRQVAQNTRLPMPMATKEQDMGLFGWGSKVGGGCQSMLGFQRLLDDDNLPVDEGEDGLVQDGASAPKGLSMEEHMHWVLLQTHPAVK